MIMRDFPCYISMFEFSVTSINYFEIWKESQVFISLMFFTTIFYIYSYAQTECRQIFQIEI